MAERTSHDLTFKRLLAIKSVQKEFLLANLPSNLRKNINVESIRAEKSDFIEDDLKAFYADVLLSFQTKTGDEGLIFALIEHQTKNDPLMPLRMIRYTCSALEQYAREHKTKKDLPVLVPIVFFAGFGKMETDVYNLFANTDLAREVSFQPPTVIQTSRIEPDALFQLPPNAFCLVSLFSYDRKGNSLFFKLLCEQKSPQAIALANKVDSEAMRITVQYLLSLLKKDPKEVAPMLRQSMPNQVDAIETAYDALIAQGIERGIEQGIEQGIEKGIEQGASEIAFKMVCEGMSDKQVHACTDLPKDAITQLRMKAKAKKK